MLRIHLNRLFNLAGPAQVEGIARLKRLSLKRTHLVLKLVHLAFLCFRRRQFRIVQPAASGNPLELGCFSILLCWVENVCIDDLNLGSLIRCSHKLKFWLEQIVLSRCLVRANASLYETPRNTLYALPLLPLGYQIE